MDAMIITNAQYYNDPDGNQAGVIATIDGTEMYVPLDTANRHYAAIIEWASQEGNTIADAD
jgi:hypothetical protein